MNNKNLERRVDLSKRKQYDQLDKCINYCVGLPSVDVNCNLYQPYKGVCVWYNTIMNDLNKSPYEKTTFDVEVIKYLMNKGEKNAI